MINILIHKDLDTSEKILEFSEKVDKITLKFSKLEKHISPTPISVTSPFIDYKIYEVKNEGVIMYEVTEKYPNKDYHNKISLLGFDEENSEVFKNLRSELEEITKTEKNLG